MLRKINLLITTVLLTVGYTFSQSGLGTLKGTVKDEVTKEPVFNATVFLKQGDVVKNRAKTDDEGKFNMNSIAPGQYDVEFKNETEGYITGVTTGVIISGDKITFLDDLTLSKPGSKKGADGTIEVQDVVIKAYKVPLINKDGGSSGGTMTREEISKLSVRSVSEVAQTVGGVTSQEGSSGINIRGSKSSDSYYFIDGIKVRGGNTSLPKSAIEEVTVVTGGLPANYGDATGGIVSVTTRGPSSKYFGSVEAVSSGFYFKGKDPNGYDGKVFGLDKYGYNLFEGMFSGPLLMKKDSLGRKVKPLLGFLLAGNITDQLDSRPIANGGEYRVKKDVRDNLLANPLTLTASNGLVSSAEFLKLNDFEKNPWRMNSRSTALSLNGKIDVRTGPSVNLTFGGTVNYNLSKLNSRQSSLLNFANNGDGKSLDWRVYGRLSQRFDNKQEGSSSKIKSAYYSVMLDYSQNNTYYYDARHRFNAFDYGHVGTFTTTRVPTTDFDSYSLTEYQTGWNDAQVSFVPSDKNPELAAYTSQYYNLYANDPKNHYEDLDQIKTNKALINGILPLDVATGIWGNIGSPYNGMSKTENQQFRFTGSGSVNIGDHALTLGFEFEQRFERYWAVNNPANLWTIARQLTNLHLKELDYSSGDTTKMGNYNLVMYDQLNSGYAYKNGGQYGGQKNSDNQYFFDYNLRNKLGLGGANSSYIDLDRLDPNLLSIDMFSSDELLNNGMINYYGYDISGKKVKGKTDIKSYFNDFDQNGNYKRTVGSFQPIYVAGYIMDKFSISDLVFNVGLRVDFFNANQPVLKDPYLLYSARTVSEVKSLVNSDPTFAWAKDIPTSVGNDYTVYVDDVNNPTAIKGFRTGSKWYDENGTLVENPITLRGPNGIAPWLLNPTDKKNNKINADAFENYKTQVNLMPRLAFSFPISDVASFFAHYDVLTKRPTSTLNFDPVQYQFISRDAYLNNSNLKPETTIDYELGFQQVLTQTSSLKIAAFYREQRNNVQQIKVIEAYPNTYSTLGNLDFGTVKGITLAYDLRKTGNIRMTANYTLQFAEGTGADNTVSASIASSGRQLRNIFPYTFDTRHQFNIVVDYRYGEGKDYNGLMIGDFPVFENTGLNLVTNIYSGSPYSDGAIITSEAAGSYSPVTGSVNGSRKPWSNRLDLQLDRTLSIGFKQKDGKSKLTFLNVYVRATNLFNHFNVINLYRGTGSWKDDGYLAADQYQSAIKQTAIYGEQSYRDFYTMSMQNGYNISAPRTIRLGLKFDF